MFNNLSLIFRVLKEFEGALMIVMVSFRSSLKFGITACMPGARIPSSFLHELVRGKLSQHLTSFNLYLDLCRNENCTCLAPLAHIVVVSGPAFYMSFSCKAMKSTILYIDTDLNF